ncbi:hypothetical protein SeLEV6574_g06354 [Synchytrium endobioticum]|uniref:Uncharacterized protein n=1 Tax=Synchytrium endobioticum TaxID=286115 RepID=A0A507CP61_9FUNG|nr:hypothetical protein SeLEV6574_g06354 [Synchytrium endobioticum]
MSINTDVLSKKSHVAGARLWPETRGSCSVRRVCEAASCGCCLEKFSFSAPNIRRDIFANRNSDNLVMDPQCTPRAPGHGNDPTTDLLAYWKTPMANVIDDALLRSLDVYYSSNDMMYWKQPLPDVDVDVELNKTARNNDAGLTDEKLFEMAPSGLRHLAQPTAVIERNCVTFAAHKETQHNRIIEQKKVTIETVDMSSASNKAAVAIHPHHQSTTDHHCSSKTYSNPFRQLYQPTKNDAGGRRQYYINNRDGHYDNCLHRSDHNSPHDYYQRQYDRRSCPQAAPSAPEVYLPKNSTNQAAALASATSTPNNSEYGNIWRSATDRSNERYKIAPLPGHSHRSRDGRRGPARTYRGRNVANFDSVREAQRSQPPLANDSNRQTSNHDATDAPKGVRKGSGNHARPSSAAAPSPPLPSIRVHTFANPRKSSGGPRLALTGAAVTTKLKPEELHVKMAEMKRQNEAIRAQTRRTQEEEAAFRRAEAMQHAKESEKRRMVGERLAAERIEADRKAEVALKAEASVMAERPEDEPSKAQGQAMQVCMSSSTANSLDQSLAYSDWADYPVEEEMDYSKAPSFPGSRDIPTSSEARNNVSTQSQVCPSDSIISRSQSSCQGQHDRRSCPQPAPSAPGDSLPKNSTNHGSMVWEAVKVKSVNSDNRNISRIVDPSNERYKSTPTPDRPNGSNGECKGPGRTRRGRGLFHFDSVSEAQGQQAPVENDSNRIPVFPSDSSSKEGESSPHNESQNAAVQADSMVKEVQGESGSKNVVDPHNDATLQCNLTEPSKPQGPEIPVSIPNSTANSPDQPLAYSIEERRGLFSSWTRNFEFLFNLLPFVFIY